MPTQTPVPAKTPTLVPHSLPPTYRVLFVRNGHLWSVDSEGNHLQRLTPTGFNLQLSPWEPTVVSPDGRHVPIWDPAKGTWLLDWMNADVRQVSAQAVTLDWAPDSRAVVYSESGKIHVRRFDQWDDARHIADGFFPKWSPNGQWIAYLTASAGSSEVSHTRHLHLIRPDGTDREEIDSFEFGNRDSGSFELQWSFDGGYLLAWSQKPQAARLWKVDGSSRSLSKMDAYNMALAAATPHLVLEDLTDHELRIFRLDAELRESKGGRCVWGTWSFDGNRLACVAASYDLRLSLLITNLDSRQSKIVSVELPGAQVLKWLPGSSSVVASNESVVPEPNDPGNIWVVNVESSEPPRLVAANAHLVAVIAMP